MADATGADEQPWDAFVTAHPQGWLCHLSAWQRFIEASFPHIRGQVLLVRSGGAIRSGLPVYVVRSWLTGNRLVSIPFATLCSPLVADERDGPELLDQALHLARVSRSRYFELRTMGGPGLAPHPVTCEATQFRHHFIRLDAGPDAIWQRLDRSCVRQRMSRARSSALRRTTSETGATANMICRVSSDHGLLEDGAGG